MMTENQNVISGNLNNLELATVKISEINKRSGYLRQQFTALVASLMSFMYGATIAWTSPTIGELQSPNSPIGTQLNYHQGALLTTVMYVSGFFGAFIWYTSVNNFSRKINAYFVGVLHVIGWSIILFSYDIYLLFVARSVLGVAGVGSLIISPIIINEIAENAVNGLLGSYSALFLNLGIVTIYAVGAAFSYRILAGFCLAIPIIFMLTFLWLPETPISLWLSGDHKSAKDSLLWYRGHNLAKLEKEIVIFTSMEISPQKATCSMLFSTKENRISMLIVLVLFFAHEFTGAAPILSYTAPVFERSNLAVNSNIAAILVGLFQLFGSIIAAIIVDKIGRRILLLISFLSIAIILSMLSTYYYLQDCTSVDITSIDWLPVVLLCSYMVLFSIGAGTVNYVVMSEIVPTNIKTLATSIALLENRFCAFICVEMFPYLVVSAGNCGCFAFFAFCSFLMFSFMALVLPETKMLSYDEISVELNKIPFC